MQEAHLNIIEACLSAASPVVINGEIDDLSCYVVIYWDGTFSNDKLEVLYNPTTHQFILHEHTLWQGGFCGYKNFSLEQYVRMLPDDEVHFARWLEGLRKIIH
jgi:hypothetical protein